MIKGSLLSKVESDERSLGKPTPLRRRDFLKLLSLAAGASLTSCARFAGPQALAARRCFFVSHGMTGIINADGTGLRYFEFEIPKQVTWQPGPIFSDGRRVVFLSMEERRDGPGRPFDKFYALTPTHIWIYDLDRDALTEICTQQRMAPFYTPALLVNDERMLVQVVRDGIGQIFSMNLDGTDAREFTRVGEGFPYGLSLSPDGKRVAFHTAGPSPHSYRIWTSDIEGRNRTLVVGHPDHIYFGPAWSPDGTWLLYQDCLFKQDPGHDWSDICIGRPDGSEHRVLTHGQLSWFGATYGNPKNKGSGSNMPTWTHDGKILFSRKTPESRVPWEYQTQRTDTDHFNRDWKPELARGGTQIVRLDPRDGSMKALTEVAPQTWDLRASESPDAEKIIFCRAMAGESPALWVMNSNGTNPIQLTRGRNDYGADQPRWLPSFRKRASRARPVGVSGRQQNDRASSQEFVQLPHFIGS